MPSLNGSNAALKGTSINGSSIGINGSLRPALTYAEARKRLDDIGHVQLVSIPRPNQYRDA
eukprot:883108-Rhodomonas_salina.4